MKDRDRRGHFNFEDSEDRFPGSCVHYTRFKAHELRKLFLYLRTKEELLQYELQERSGEKERFICKIKLQEVQAFLCYMVSNFEYFEVIPARQNIKTRGVLNG